MPEVTPRPQVEYVFQEYPKMKFSKSGSYTIVNSAEEERALQGEWSDSLRDMGIETCPAAPKAVPLAAIIPGFVPPPAEPVAVATEEESSSRRGRS